MALSKRREKKTMANSINELKKALNLTTVRVKWNDPFPFNELIDLNKDNPVLNERIERFSAQISMHRLDNSCVNKKDLTKIGTIADACDITLAYFVTTPLAIDIFFYEKMETEDWLAMFKTHCTRRQFFKLVYTLRNIKYLADDFALANYYQMISPSLPLGYSAAAKRIDDDYIIVSYTHDVESPILRVIKIKDNGFETLIPEIHCDLNEFNSITLKFDGKTYSGDSIKTLFDGKEKEYGESTVCTAFNDEFHILDAENGTVQIQSLTGNHDNDDYFSIEKFRKTTKISVILEVKRNNKKALLLNNGYIWFLHDDTFKDILSISGLEHLNLDIFMMSSVKKGIVLSRDTNSIELVPAPVIENMIYRLL